MRLTNPLSRKPSSSPTALGPLPHWVHVLPPGCPLAFSPRLSPWGQHSRQTSVAAILGISDASCHHPKVSLVLRTPVCICFLFPCLLLLLLISLLLSLFVEASPCADTMLAYIPWEFPSLTPFPFHLDHHPWLQHTPALQGTDLCVT